MNSYTRLRELGVSVVLRDQLAEIANRPKIFDMSKIQY